MFGKREREVEQRKRTRRGREGRGRDRETEIEASRRATYHRATPARSSSAPDSRGCTHYPVVVLVLLLLRCPTAAPRRGGVRRGKEESRLPPRHADATLAGRHAGCVAGRLVSCASPTERSQGSTTESLLRTQHPARLTRWTTPPPRRGCARDKDGARGRARARDTHAQGVAVRKERARIAPVNTGEEMRRRSRD